MVSMPTLAADGYGPDGKFLAPIDSPVAGSIEVSNRTQLEAIKNNLSGNYHLGADIDLSGEDWVPIGDANNPFTGTFDGQGCIIKNMRITEEGYELNGLFGYVWVGFVKNLGLEDTYIDVTRSSSSFDEPTYSKRYIYAGGIYGYSSNYIFGVGYRDCSISNCYNTGYISISSASNVYANGGGIGGGGGGDVVNCYNAGEVVSSSTVLAYAGGIAGIGTSIK